MPLRTTFSLILCSSMCATTLVACESILGLDELSVADSASDGGVRPVRGEVCGVLAGPERDERAIRIGALAATSGPQAAANLARQASAMLAVDAINAAGGVPIDGTAHPLVLIGCDARGNLLGAGKQLVSELGVRAIVGPDESEDSFALATKIAIPNDTLVVNPVATATLLVDLLDEGLQWSMVSNDALRAPWMKAQLEALEAALRLQRGRSDLKLAIAVRADTQGQSARVALRSLTFGGESITELQNLGSRVRIDAYSPDASDQDALVDAYVKFAPDIVVLLGMTEAVTQILGPLEQRWAAASLGVPPPEYLVTDAARVPDLASIASRNESLRARIRGVGATFTASASAANAAFVEAYRRRFPREVEGISGLASTYDAVHAIAFAAATAGEFPVSGRALARGLRSLSNRAANTPLDVRPEQLASALEQIEAGEPLRVGGAFGPLAWDDRGAPVEGALEVFCVGSRSGRPYIESSAARAGLGAAPPVLGARGCEAPGALPPGGTTGRPPDTMPPMTPPPPVPANDAGAMVPMEPTPTEPEPTEPAPMEPMQPGPMRPPATGKSLTCGDTACDPRAGEICCVPPRENEAGWNSEDFRCVRGPERCEGDLLRCGSDVDCGAGEACCFAGGSAECVPEGMCDGTRLSCSGVDSCEQGQICCARSGDDGRYQSIECAAECQPWSGDLALCETDEDCSAIQIPARCGSSSSVPNLMRCEPTGDWGGQP
jgi:ABC-type branched-subunit amino acid transport system substrate-binding protein